MGKEEIQESEPLRIYAEISANIFSANGIKVYLFEDMRQIGRASCRERV